MTTFNDIYINNFEIIQLLMEIRYLIVKKEKHRFMTFMTHGYKDHP